VNSKSFQFYEVIGRKSKLNQVSGDKGMWARLVPGCGYLSSGDPHTPVGTSIYPPFIFGHPPTTKEDDRNVDKRRIKI